MLFDISIRYGSYGVVQKYLMNDRQMGDTAIVASLAGLASGVPEALTVQPTQVVKVRLQAKEHKGKYNGPIDCCQKLLRNEGIMAFTIGLGPTIWRNCVWNTVYFGLMHRVKQILPATHSELEKTFQTFISGFLGAVTATCFNAPFDVVKSRFQCQVASQTAASSSSGIIELKYKNTFQTLFLIYKEEGIIACYKGFKPKAIRMGLGGATAMSVYELVIKLFK